MSGSNSETQLLKILCRSEYKTEKAKSKNCGGQSEGRSEEERGAVGEKWPEAGPRWSLNS